MRVESRGSSKGQKKTKQNNINHARRTKVVSRMVLCVLVNLQFWKLWPNSAALHYPLGVNLDSSLVKTDVRLEWVNKEKKKYVVSAQDLSIDL